MLSAMSLRYLLKGLLLPPVPQLLGLVLACFWWRSSSAKKRGVAKALMVLSIGSLWLLSTPKVSHTLIETLQHQYPAIAPEQVPQLVQQAQAIIVLGGGRRLDAPEFNGDVVSSQTLERLRYAAHLHRQSGLPLLVSGGRVFDETQSEAELMALELSVHFQVLVRWQEDGSRTTAENAKLSYQLLQQSNITRVALVTQAWHMPRAVMVYEQAGFNVVAAPTAFTRLSRNPIGHWLPSTSALFDSRVALHEWLGYWVYKITE